MTLKLIKAAIRPFYRILQRTGVIRTAGERQLKEMEWAYDRFHALSKNKNIDSVTFQKGQCIFRLTDKRQYYFDPHERAARMYSVPLTGTFERKETEFLRSTIKRGQVCIDVGACFGWYTLLFSSLVGQTGHVHAFEPLSDNYRVLARNLALNEAKNVTLNSSALTSAVPIDTSTLTLANPWTL